MTRRQVYFCIPERGTYYVSEEINGDKEEMERMGSSDSCEKNWAEILDGLKNVSTLGGFLQALAIINGLYHSSIGMELPATKLHLVRSHAEIGVKDQTYGIVDGTPGAFLDEALSIWKEVS